MYVRENSATELQGVIFLCQQLDRDACVCVFWTYCSSIPLLHLSRAVKEKKTCQTRRVISQPPVSNRNKRNRGVFPVPVKKKRFVKCDSSSRCSSSLQWMPQTFSFTVSFLFSFLWAATHPHIAQPGPFLQPCITPLPLQSDGFFFLGQLICIV